MVSSVPVMKGYAFYSEVVRFAPATCEDDFMVFTPYQRSYLAAGSFNGCSGICTIKVNT
jgi:hypothetical protein